MLTRLYSRICGSRSIDSVTYASGIAAASISPIRRSWAGLTNDHSSDTADRLDAMSLERRNRGVHIVFVEWRDGFPVGHHTLLDRHAQMTGNEHRRRREEEVVAVTVFLVCEPDLQRVLVPAGADQTDAGTLVLDQRVERHRRAVDAEVALGEEIGQGGAGTSRRVDAGRR